MRPSIKRIDLIKIFKSNSFEQMLRRNSLLSDSTNDESGSRIQQREVNFFGKKALDEFFIMLAHVIGFLIRKTSETPSKRLPKFTSSFVCKWRGQFTENFRFKSLGEHRHIKKSDKAD